MADLPENPNNREEEYLADMAGQDGAKPNKPWSRKEAYLDAIDGRMDGIEQQIAALATDISLKGSVASQTDLPETATVGDAYITEDTGVMYVYVGESGAEPWVALGGSGGGDGMHAALYADSTKFVASVNDLEFYKEASLTTKWTAGDIANLIINGADITIIVKNPSEDDETARYTLNVLTCHSPKTPTDETLNEVGLDIFAINCHTGTKYRMTSYGPLADTYWMVGTFNL